MFKILHIHTDLKFYHSSQRFPEDVENHHLYIGKLHKQADKEKFNFIFEVFSNGENEIVEISNRYDAVVMYGLSADKAKVVNRLNENVIIFWRFFGLELYGPYKNDFLTPATLSVLRETTQEKIGRKLASILRNPFNPIAKRFSNIKSTGKDDFTNAVKRCDYFLGYMPEEYDYFKSKYPKFPKYFQLPMRFFLDENRKEKQDIILVGNNQLIFNNHFDTFKRIDVKAAGKYKFLLPFSYNGNNPLYTKKVTAYAQKRNNFELLTKQIPLQEYTDIFLGASAALYYTIRQMAVGNIFIALRSGVKIYLPVESFSYKWLNGLGLKVYDIDSIGNDLENDNCRLTQGELDLMEKTMQAITEKYSTAKFRESVKSTLKKGR